MTKAIWGICTAIACLTFLISGCSTARDPLDQIPKADTSGSQPTVHPVEFDLASSSIPTQVLLSPDDTIRLTVLSYPALSTIAIVQQDGSVSLPLIGELPAANRSIADLRHEVEERFLNHIKPKAVKFRMGDTVRLSVWQQPELSSDATVIADGTLTFPLAGRIKAEGRSLSEVSQEVADRISEHVRNPKVVLMPQNFNRDLLLQPQASLTIEKLRARTLAVLGEVNMPGLLQIPGGSIRVMDVLAMANHRNTADLNSVVVIRNYKDREPAYRQLHMNDFMDGSDLTQNIYLRPDDIVFVPKTTIAKVDEFIDNFFSRTRPVFDWWISYNNARYAADTGENAQLYNNYLSNILAP